MKKHVLTFVRAIRRGTGSRPEDVALAKTLAKEGPCTVVMLGQHRRTRIAVLRREFGISADENTKSGVTVNAPVEVSGDDWTAADEAKMPGKLAAYLIDTGIRMIARTNANLRVELPTDIDPASLAAVVEAVMLYPGVKLTVGGVDLDTDSRWILRRDRFRAPPILASRGGLIGTSAAMETVRDRVSRYADLPYPVLLIGETGSGKEIVAQMLHEQSGRKDKGKFMATNAANLPPNLAESLLFGHVKGAYTDAGAERPGRIREAGGGTFFLDEAFNLDPGVQGKLLRAFNRAEEGIIEVEPLGSSQRIVVHARLVVAAQQDPRLERAVAGGTPMREDLFYRVALGVIEIPPLRDRLEDIVELAQHLLAGMRAAPAIDDEAEGVLRQHDWPGNVRELRLVLLRAVVDGEPGAKRIGADIVRAAMLTAALPSRGRSIPLPCALDLELKRIEVETMQAALRSSGANHAEAGRRIGMGKNAQNFKRTLELAEVKLRELGERHER
jgi:DNA-binding NtrC family response regulator